MKTLIDATLFIVRGPRGPYYALVERESGAVLTERTELAATATANEKDMLIVDRQEISHADLLAMMAARCETRRAPQSADQPPRPPDPCPSPPSTGLAALARRLLGRETGA